MLFKGDNSSRSSASSSRNIRKNIIPDILENIFDVVENIFGIVMYIFDNVVNNFLLDQKHNT